MLNFPHWQHTKYEILKKKNDEITYTEKLPHKNCIKKISNIVLSINIDIHDYAA